MKNTADQYGNTRIVVKNIKHAAFASQETNCYTASVYFDGKRIGEAHNSGHGGETYFENYQITDKAKMKEAEAYAETLAPLDCTDLGSSEPLPMNLELLLDSIVENHLNEKYNKSQETRMKRLCKTRTVLKEGNEFFTLTPGKYRSEWKDRIVAQYPNATIMNEAWGII